MIGRRVHRYEITARLGEGGMGVVWKAEDPLLGRTVALKLLPASLASSPDARRRFLREARAASRLKHPGIAAIHDAGDDGGQIYLAFELVDGETVHDRLARGPLEIAGALDIARQTAEALEHAHAHGVLHRDVTSRNVMIDRHGRAMIVDFGLAQPEGHTRLTRTGAATGTAAYIAPEVIEGRPADVRADVYGLGVVLYEMLTGRPPFTGERPEAILYAATHRDPPPPTSLRAGLPSDVERVVLDSLRKDPDDRYPTAAALVAAIQSVSGGGPALSPAEALLAAGARDATAGPARHRRAAGRPATWIAAVSVILGITLAVLWSTGLPPFGAAGYASVAILPLRNASAEPMTSDHLAQGLSQAVIAKLTLVGVRVSPWVTAQLYSDVSRPLPEIARELNVDALVLGEFSRSGETMRVSVSLIDGRDGLQVWTDEIDVGAGAILDLQSRLVGRLSERLKGSLTPSEEAMLARAPSRSAEAYELYLRGSFIFQDENRRSGEIALRLFRRAVELDPDLAEAHVGIGAIHKARYYYGWGGHDDLVQAEASFRTAMRLDPELGSARGGLIRIHFERGESRQCLEIAQQVLATGKRDVPALQLAAEGFFMGFLPERAIPLLQEILRVDPGNPAGHWFLAMASVWAGRFEDGIDAGGEFLRRFGDDPELLTWMGLSYHELGEPDLARAHYRAAMEIFGEDPSDSVYVFAGNLLEQEGRTEEAAEVRARGIALFRDRLEAAPDNARMARALAELLALAGDPGEANDILDELLRGHPAARPDRADSWGVLRLVDPGCGVATFRQHLRIGSYHPLMWTRLRRGEMLERLDTCPGYDDFVRDAQETRARLLAEFPAAG